MGQVGIEPTSSDLQSGALTNFATAPLARVERFELSQYDFGDRLAQPTLTGICSSGRIRTYYLRINSPQLMPFKLLKNIPYCNMRYLQREEVTIPTQINGRTD